MSYRIDKEKYKKVLFDSFLTTQDVCKKSGLAYSTIHHAVNTGRSIRPKTARIIADTLGVPFEKIQLQEETGGKDDE